ncbi:ribosomal protein L22 [Bulleidia extructa W1219]|jgi:ribosomal protein L22|uniref:Large ribosomal subunit protein uL22 n=1 Tax=Bulleidia extructa W1219 TaxID=679192 RepID=D2MME5_9FIRM|nr:50S ribosomal protein L22 [Bulleidia extructa]EFC06221.1 ribosomal protein L22 [Bulleidia extructa W1219]
MDVKSTAKTVRYTPRKVRLVLDLVRGKSVEEALAILQFMPNHAATAVAKVVKSAAANATHNHQLNAEALYVKECYANEGVVMKRFMPRAKGNAAQILKRTSHITVVVSDVK